MSLTEEQKNCIKCYKTNLFYLSCGFYSRLISLGAIKLGDKCIWKERIGKDLEKFVLGYEPELRDVVEEIMKYPVEEKK